MNEWCKRVLLGLPMLLLSCEKESPHSDAPKPAESSAEKSVALDPDLAQAMAAASAAPAKPGAAVPGGPPPNGIFPPGAADHEVKKGDAPKVTLGSEGQEPRITLVPAQPKPGTKQSGTIQVVQQQAEGGGIPIEFAVTFEALKPKADAGPSAPVPASVKVTGARIADLEMYRVPTGQFLPRRIEGNAVIGDSRPQLAQSLSGGQVEKPNVPAKIANSEGSAVRAEVPKCRQGHSTQHHRVVREIPNARLLLVGKSQVAPVRTEPASTAVVGELVRLVQLARRQRDMADIVGSRAVATGRCAAEKLDVAVQRGNVVAALPGLVGCIADTVTSLRIA